MSISLKIKGNKRGNEGIGADLVRIGDDRFPVIDAQYPGAKGVTYFIVMRHLPDKSIYTIVCTNVTPCDSPREGTLYIAVAVPAKEHVEGLFNMLIELQNAFKSSYMRYDGTWYHFTDRPENPQIFAGILSRYKVDRYPYRTVTTTEDTSSIAYLYLTAEQISDILNDPMRGEFSRFGQIVFVPVADPAAYTSTINVPAKIWRSYKIYVNGRQTGQTLSDPNKTVTITLPETASHESASTTFSISQARETRMPGIAVDDEAQIIYLNLQPKPKPKPVIPRTSSIDTAIAEANRKKKNKLYAIIAACAVVAIAALVYFLCFSSKDDKKPANNTPVNNAQNTTDQTDTIPENEKVPEWGSGSEENPDNDNEASKEINDDQSEDLYDDALLIESSGKDKGNGKGNESVEDEKAKKERERANHSAKYRTYVYLINTGNLSFEKFDEIKKFYTNYTNEEGYELFAKQVVFVDKVVTYIKGLNKNPKVRDYTKKINSFINEANELGLYQLEAKLKERISSGDTNAIKETYLITDRF